MRRCRISVGLKLLAEVLRLPPGIEVVASLPYSGLQWPPSVVELILEGDGLPDDCEVIPGGMVKVKTPQLQTTEETIELRGFKWDWR